MILIAKSPILGAELKDVPETPIEGTKGLYAKEDGWYIIDDEGNTTRIASLDDLSEKLDYKEVSESDIDKMFEIPVSPFLYKVIPEDNSYQPYFMICSVPTTDGNVLMDGKNYFQIRFTNGIEVRYLDMELFKWSEWESLIGAAGGDVANYIVDFQVVNGDISNGYAIYISTVNKDGNINPHTLAFVDTKVSEESKNLVSSGAVYNAMKDKVEKEEGKGLSVYTDVLSGVYDDPNVNAEVTEIELVSASGNSGDNKYITFFTAEQTDAYIDKKLADLPQGGSELDVQILNGANLNTVLNTGIYAVTSNCIGLPEEALSLSDIGNMVLYVINDGDDEEWSQVQQILYIAGVEGVSYIFQRLISINMIDLNDITVYDWGAISGGSGGASDTMLLEDVDLNQVFDAGRYAVAAHNCTNVPDGIDEMDSPTVTMFVVYEEDEEYELATQILFSVDCLGDSRVDQRQIERYKRTQTITAYPWGTISSGSSGGNVDLSDYVKKEDGKGLSKVSEIIVTTPTLDEIGDCHEITILENDANETSNTYDFFSTAQVMDRLNLKADKSEGTYYTHVFQNLLNPDEIESGYINPATGTLASHATYKTTGYIAVKPGDVVGMGINTTGTTVAPLGINYMACYDENKTVIPNAITDRTIGWFTVPDNAYFVRMSYVNSASKPVSFEVLNNIGNAPHFLNYGETLEYTVPRCDMDIRFFLPKFLYMYDNSVFDIYYSAIFASTLTDYTIELSHQANSSTATIATEDRKMVVTTKNKGAMLVAMNVINSKGIRVASKRFYISVKTRLTDSKVIAPIGDSLTNAKPWEAEVIRLNNNLTFVGCKTSTQQDSEGTSRTYGHCGHSGWDSNIYCNKPSSTYSGSSEINPLWDASLNDGAGGFSWNYYVTNSLGGVAPDVVNFFVGMNDIEKDLDERIGYIKIMIDDILTAQPEVKIILCTPQYRDYKRSSGTISGTYNFMVKMYDTFKDYANVVFMPIALYHDSEYNYIKDTTATVNPRSTITTDNISDVTHPQKPGYWQIADAVFSALSAI